MGAILRHPSIALLNAKRIERGESFDFYADGVTPLVAETLATADAERLRVADAYGEAVQSLTDWIGSAYGHRAGTIQAAVGGNPAYVGIKAPSTLRHRYLLEDVPTGLIPLIELGEAAGLALPTLRRLVNLGRIKLGAERWQRPRTLVALGLAGKTTEEIRNFVALGVASVTSSSKSVMPAPTRRFGVGDGCGRLHESDGELIRMKKELIVGAAIGDCVHVAGVVNFLNLAEQLGYETVCLGPAISIDALLEKVADLNPEMVAVGYRLTPENCRNLLRELSAKASVHGQAERSWLFGGTEPCVAVAQETGLFQMTFSSGTSKQAVVAYLRGEQADATPGAPPPQTLAGRIGWKAPYPLLRHHFGRPTVDETVAGAVAIAQAECLDVLSLGTDQNAQEHFFRPAEMDPSAHGAGGVPVRTEADLEMIYAHTRLGNFPIMRCYSGTRDIHEVEAPMLAKTINNAWCAIPLFWYTQLDGRSPRPLREAIPETQALMRWHAEHNIPVEMNESHHWSLRDAPDVVAVVAAYLAAYNARASGVQNYVQQLMFNNPPNTSPVMDLGKMLAKLELVEGLQNDHFRVWRETRGGLTSYPPDPSVARGHLASTVCLQMQLKPHIVHIVGHTEAHHATTAAELIEACRITDGAISQCLLGLPDMTGDARVQRRKAELLADAAVLLNAIAHIAPKGCDPCTDAGTLAQAVEMGLLDAPHLRGNAAACGKIVTGMVGGACLAVERGTGKPIPEAERVARILGRSTPGGKSGRTKATAAVGVV